MFNGALEGLSMMLLKYLRVPPGVHVRSANNSSVSGDIENNDYISTIVDITVDDICISNSPLTYKSEFTLTDDVKGIVDDITNSINKVLRWVAKDLCIKGFSVYESSVSKRSGKLLITPFLDDVDLYLDAEGDVLVYNRETEEKYNLDNMIVFLNYDRSSFEKVDDDKALPKGLKFRIKPIPMQLKNAEKTARLITLAENNMMRYRTQLSRLARFVSVDIGASQGDKKDEVVDGISSAINADSMSLSFDDSSCEFDDGIPVIPHRKGIGKPELTTDVPNYNLGELGDLEYLLNKLTLLMRFPATYMDFTKSLDSSVATTLRGDLRYARMCEAVRSKIEDTINDVFAKSEKFSRFGLTFVMNTSPSTEDSDVVDTLSQFVDATQQFYGFVMGDNEEEPIEDKMDRLNAIRTLFLGSCSSKAINDWFTQVQDSLVRMNDAQESGASQPMGVELGGGGEFNDGGGFGGLGGRSEDTEEEEPLDNVEPQDKGQSEATSTQGGVELFDLQPGE